MGIARRALLALAVTLALSAGAAAFVFGAAAPPVSGDGVVAVDCDIVASGIQVNCSHPVGATFDIEINVVDAPANGYFGHQMKLAWNDPQLDYLPTASPSDENLWVNCTIPIRLDNQTGSPPNPSMLFGCVPLPPLFVGKTTTGPILQFEFSCQQAGSTALALVPRAGDPQQGSHFVDGGANPIDPTLVHASIDCLAAPTYTPTPTLSPTATPSPTPTPTPTSTPDVDADSDGCTNGQELSPDPAFGGMRDPFFFWDFFDTPELASPRDRIISTGDIVRILGRFGTTGDSSIDPLSPPPASGYHTAFDRSAPVAGGPWNLELPDGVIAANDLLFAVNQFGHTCA